MPRKPISSDSPAELRRRAELRLSGRSQKPARNRAHAGNQRQLHELEVHQIELELQNAELQKARNELEAALEKYTDLYDFAPVGYLALDELGQILEANLSAAALLGVGRARLINQRLLPFVLPASRPDVLAFLKLVFAGAGKQVCEAMLLRENSTPFFASLHGSSAISVSGPRIRCRVVISDISVLRHAEAAQHRLAAIVESSEDAIIGMDLNGVVSSWNKGAETIFGYSASERVGASIMRLIPPSRQAEGKLILAKVRRGESVRHFETVRQTKQGRQINVSITSSPIRDASGQIIGASKVARDISERKRAEAMLRQHEALVSTLVARAPVGVYVVDARFCLRQVNPRARLVFKNVRPLIGRNFAEAIHLIWPRRVADLIVKRFQHTLKTGKPYVSPGFAERRRDTDAKEFYEWQIQRVTLPHGEHGVVCFFNNITERKRAEAAQRRSEVLSASNRKLESEIVRRQRMEEALKKSYQHQNRLLAQSRLLQEQLRNLSHQILSAQEEERKRISRELHDIIAQTLTGITVHLAGLRITATRNPEGLEKIIGRAQRMVEQSVKVIHQFTRELRPAVLDDLGLIPALNTFMKSFQAETGLRVSLSAEAAAVQVQGDQRIVLYRVAQEALTNIARHAQARRADVKILKLDRTVCMTITDDGKGFRQELLLQKKKQQRLGLLGMRERVQMVKGSFTIQSTPGKGTTVRVQIPLAGGGERVVSGSRAKR